MSVIESNRLLTTFISFSVIARWLILTKYSVIIGSKWLITCSSLWTLSILLCLGSSPRIASFVTRFKFFKTISPIRTTSFTAFSTANAGVSRIRGSKWRNAFSSGSSSSSSSTTSSWIIIPDNLTNAFANGNNNIVTDTLKIEWKIEICVLDICCIARSGNIPKKIVMITP